MAKYKRILNWMRDAYKAGDYERVPKEHFEEIEAWAIRKRRSAGLAELARQTQEDETDEMSAEMKDIQARRPEMDRILATIPEDENDG